MPGNSPWRKKTWFWNQTIDQGVGKVGANVGIRISNHDTRILRVKSIFCSKSFLKCYYLPAFIIEQHIFQLDRRNHHLMLGKSNGSFFFWKTWPLCKLLGMVSRFPENFNPIRAFVLCTPNTHTHTNAASAFFYPVVVELKDFACFSRSSIIIITNPKNIPRLWPWCTRARCNTGDPKHCCIVKLF